MRQALSSLLRRKRSAIFSDSISSGPVFSLIPYRNYIMESANYSAGRVSPFARASSSRSTCRFIAPPCASGNSAPLRACGAPVSGARFAVGALPRCASVPPRAISLQDLLCQRIKKRAQTEICAASCSVVSDFKSCRPIRVR